MLCLPPADSSGRRRLSNAAASALRLSVLSAQLSWLDWGEENWLIRDKISGDTVPLTYRELSIWKALKALKCYSNIYSK
jgi:hypothetical protein